jgi:hypothetical protein
MLLAIGALTVAAANITATSERMAGLASVSSESTKTAATDDPAGPSAATTEPRSRVGGTDVDATRRGLEALAVISYDWVDLLPDWEIRFHAAASGAYGYTVAENERIDIYVRTEESEALLAHVIAHELGHAVDVSFNDGDDRRRWLDVRGIDDVPWWPENRAADFATGAGDFAESFAAWQVGDASFRSKLGPPPNAEARALLAALAGP